MEHEYLHPGDDPSMNLLSTEASAFVLPLQLADGLVLSGIELECRTCARAYRLTQGQGRASGKGRRIALAAQACCPSCAAPAHFLVVVDARLATARVQRVSRLGLWLAQWLISLRAERPASPSIINLTVPAPVASAREEADLVCSDESLGSFQGAPIPAWISVDGVRCHYVGIANDHFGFAPVLEPGEHLLTPGLLYREEVDLMI